MLTVSITIPTRNEESSIKGLLQGIWDALASTDIKYEVVVVDDSDDATPIIAKKMGARVVKGQRKGLGEAIIDGIKAANSDVVLVMDADGSHSPKSIPALLKPILEQGCELTIGSRYVNGGDYSNWALNRKIKSIIGSKLMQLVTGVKDSNSGFFAFRKSIINGVELKPHSWKIMLEVLFKGSWGWKQEVPITFKDRTGGVSKNSNKERARHAWHMIKLVAYKMRRFISFALVGGTGNIWHFGLLYALTEWGHVWYMWSGVIAVLVAGTSNYLLNHYITFRHDKSENKSLWLGWLKYGTGNGIGDSLQLVLMFVFTQMFDVWYMLSAAIATGVTLIFKFSLLKSLVWGKPKRKASDADYEWVSYFKGLPWQKRWKRIIASIVKEFAEYPSGNAGKVLDVGCGSSPQGLLINHADYTGYDWNNAKIRYMNAKQLDGHCGFITGGVNEIQDCVLSGSMDTVLFVEVIEHLKDMDEACDYLDVIYDKLKPNGRLIVATPNYGGFTGKWMDRLYGVFQKGAYKEDHHLKFNLSLIQMICRMAGFRYVKSKIPSGADMVCLFEKNG